MFKTEIHKRLSNLQKHHQRISIIMVGIINIIILILLILFSFVI